MAVPSMPVRLLSVIACLAICACSGGSARTAASVVGEETEDGRPVCPLTGQAARSDGDAARPALAVKVENSSNARPQSGLGEADLVYEEPVEGGLAWFVAVFQCSEPQVAGPVRNAHPADASLLAAHGPLVFAHAGATPAVVDSLRGTAGLQQVDARLTGNVFERSADRPVPHNLYVSMPKLRALAKETAAPRPWASFQAPQPKEPKAAASPSPTAKPRTGSTVQFTQGGAVVRYTYDAPAGRYVRQQGAPPAPFLDEAGKPVQVTNLLFMWIPVGEGETRDAAGNRTPVLTLTGKGDALLLRDGRETSGSWSRKSVSDPPTLRDTKGKPMLLSPGKTWIHLLPTDLPVYVR